MAELQILLECFANYKSLDGVLDAIDTLVDDTHRDQGLKEWFKAVDGYICKVFSPIC
jgi:Family of unknown function (DUF5923)